MLVMQKLDLFSAIMGVTVSFWVIVALLVLVESIRREKMVPASLFYVVTMATFLITGPVLPSIGVVTRVMEGVIMFANIIVHAWQLSKLRVQPEQKSDGETEQD